MTSQLDTELSLRGGQGGRPLPLDRVWTTHLVEQEQQGFPKAVVPHVEADDGQVGAIVVQVEETLLVVGVVHDLSVRNYLEGEALGSKGGFQFPQGGKVIVILLAGKEDVREKVESTESAQLLEVRPTCLCGKPEGHLTHLTGWRKNTPVLRVEK